MKRMVEVAVFGRIALSGTQNGIAAQTRSMMQSMMQACSAPVKPCQQCDGRIPRRKQKPVVCLVSCAFVYFHRMYF